MPHRTTRVNVRKCADNASSLGNNSLEDEVQSIQLSRIEASILALDPSDVDPFQIFAGLPPRVQGNADQSDQFRKLKIHAMRSLA
jgi:hypothetical protein